MGVVVSVRLNKATHLCRSPGGEVNVMGPGMTDTYTGSNTSQLSKVAGNIVM